MGKGNKERIVPIPESVIQDYHIAIAEYECFTETANSELTDKSAIERRIRKYAVNRKDKITHSFTDTVKLTKIEGKKSLHALRHTYALRMFVELGEIHLVQKLLGHSSVTVTEVYTKFPVDYLKGIFTYRLNRGENNTLA